MANKFALLHSSGSDDEEDESPLAKRSPQYSIEKILGMFKPSSIGQAPNTLKTYGSIYIKEVQSPECNTFRPPNNDINASMYNQQNKIAQRAQPAPPVRQPKKFLNKKRNDSNPLFEETKMSEDEIAQSWFYKDLTGYVLGPYPSKLMKKWFDEKLIDSTILICQGSANGEFKSVSTTFQDCPPFQERPKEEKPLEIIKNVKIDLRRPEKKLTTLFSFSVDDSNDDLLESWEKSDTFSLK